MNKELPKLEAELEQSSYGTATNNVNGPGETLTYAVQRVLARHSLAREFPGA
jgi:hypothetical protein